MEQVLVTGGAGFIGSHVAEELVTSGYSVTVLDDLSGGFEANVPDGAEFVDGSIEDYELLGRLFSEKEFAFVFHLAAYAAEGLSHFIRRFNYSNNLIGSANLINLAVIHGVKCFVFTSSIAVYGKSQLPMSEDTVPAPEDPYGIAKYAVEMDLKAAHEMFGLNSIVFRPHNVYGERQHIGDKYRNVIGIFMNQIMTDQPLTVFGDGEQTRAFSYVKDVAPVIARSVRNPEAFNETFNVGADKPYTVNELAEVISRAFDATPEVNRQPARNEVVHAYSTHEKLEEFFDYSSGYSLEAGVRLMAEWAKRVGPQEPIQFKDIEVANNLPPIWRS